MNIRTVITILSFATLVSCSKDGYRVEDGMVVYEKPWNEGKGTVIKRLKADPATFKVLGSDNLSWAKDDKTIFREYHVLKDVLYESFEVLNSVYAKDRKHVFCGSEQVVEADPDSFDVLDLKGWSNSDGRYGSDKNAIYLCYVYGGGYTRIPTKSKGTIKELADGFYQDEFMVSWQNNSLPNVNPKKFKALKGGYGTDGTHVYFHHKLVEGADPKTFKAIDFALAKDKNHKYEFEDRIE